MNSLWEVPIPSVVSLSPEMATTIIRAILRSEYAYAKLGPSSLTISERLMTPDGGIDAEIDVPLEHTVPEDCIFQSGITGFQIKAGSSFKAWTLSSIQGELLNNQGELGSEIERLLQRRGNYSVLSTGHDLTPKQRNDAKDLILKIFEEKGFKGYDKKVDVFGASQIAEFAERYPGIVSLLITDPIQEAWTLEEWRHDAHMANVFEESPEQAEIISHIRMALQSETKHIRILAEAGLGKTRIVLESLKDQAFSSYVLYIQHGSQFGQTKLFRQLLKSTCKKPLILVIDELPESALSDIWRHLKPRCGYLKIISMDHGRDETRDEEIDRIQAPYLPENTIKNILASRIGQSAELDRWVEICEGSPRVALAVAENLSANPSDLLKPPTTIPIWKRFLHGYGDLDDTSTRQIDCVSQHIALFSRFGYEAPVDNEAAYIVELIREVDPTIGKARFQEIIHKLRSRRVLQGSRTLFFVPKALHIYLWKQYWESYGQGFDFNKIFFSMPDSLHVWFMNMFKYADEAATSHVIGDILKLDGIFSQKENLTSEKGSKFLSILAEANPPAVLRLLESTIGTWADEELFDLKENRQTFVWTLEKIAVWPNYTVRAMKVLVRLASNENAQNSNNATGTLLSLFHIGPGWATTEAPPETRLPVLLTLLRSENDNERHLGLKAAEASLKTHGMGFRIVGPEYQGLKECAKLWIPKTRNDWWQAYHVYFQALVKETNNWPSNLRTDVCHTLLIAVENQLQIPPCTELAFEILETLANDDAISSIKLNHFFSNWRNYKNGKDHPEITERLYLLERNYTQRNLVTRFHRYVLDVDWLEWEDEHREKQEKTKSRAKVLVKAMARRIVQTPEKFDEIRHLLTPEQQTVGLSFFGEQLAKNDTDNYFLPQLIELTLEAEHLTCLYGYLNELKKINPELYLSTINSFLDADASAWLGTHIVITSDYDDILFEKCLCLLNKGWITPEQLGFLRYGGAINHVPNNRLESLFQQLSSYQSHEALNLLIELLANLPFDDSSPFDSEFVYGVISRSIPADKNQQTMSGYYWEKVSRKLVEWDESYALPLLDLFFEKMEADYRLSDNSDVVSLSYELVKINPLGTWNVIKVHFEKALPNWRLELLDWLKGGIGGFEEKESRPPIADLPFHEILEWIGEDAELRAGLIAHAAPQTLDDTNGGQLTRELLHRYGKLKGVHSGISTTFHSGGWWGPASAFYKRKRDKFRRWLAAGFEAEVIQWIESEIEGLDRDIEREEMNEERSRFE